MKIKAFFTLLLVTCSIHASAITLSDVGDLDIFTASTTLANSGDAAESAWVSSVLGSNVVITSKNDSESSDWELLNSPDVYGAALDGTPSYFLLKLGTGGTSLFSHYLFKNVGNLAFAGIDFSDAGIVLGKNINIGRISHVTEFSSVKVSEPGLAVLLLLGLAGLFSVRRSSNRS